MKSKIFLLLLPLQMLSITGCGAVEDKGGDQDMAKKQNGAPAHIHIIGEAEPIQSIGKAISENDVEDRTNQAIRNYEAGKYDIAIAELKGLLEVAGSDKWVIRSVLGRSYEAKGEYALALDQINWQIEQQPRPDVLDELLTRKQKLEELLAKQGNST